MQAFSEIPADASRHLIDGCPAASAEISLLFYITIINQSIIYQMAKLSDIINSFLHLIRY